MRGESKLILACLEMQQKFKDVLDPKEAKRNELQAKSDQFHCDLSKARRRMEQLEKDIAHLEWERPDRYIHWKGRVGRVISYVVGRLAALFGSARQACRKWMDRRKTHPLY